ncbi:MAG: GGDEF domain-containing protein [Ferrimicrobium sp.]
MRAEQLWDSVGTVFSRLARSMLFRPGRALAFFAIAAAVAILSVMLLQDMPRVDDFYMFAVSVVLIVGAVIRFIIEPRLPAWTLHIGVVVGVALFSVPAAIGVQYHFPLATLYIWVGIFSALYFRPVVVASHLSVAGVAYMTVLVLSPHVDDPVANWLAVFGTAAVSAAVVLALVNILRNDARQDPLTGLANRRSWEERLEEEMGRARRSGTALSVAMMDIDGFKSVNDLEGHAAGDRLLCELTAVWLSIIRDGSDFLARVGGDEFGLLLPGLDAVDLSLVVIRLREVTRHGVSCSIGVVSWNGSDSGGELLHKADMAMYQAKSENRGDR